MTLATKLQNYVVQHLCANALFDDIAIVPVAKGWTEAEIEASICTLGAAREEGDTEPDAAADFTAWIKWRNRGRKAGAGILVQFPIPVSIEGEGISVSELLELTITVEDFPDLNRVEGALNWEWADIVSEIRAALNARRFALLGGRTLQLRQHSPVEYEVNNGQVTAAVHFRMMGGDALSPRVTIGGLEREQTVGNTIRARVTSGTTGAVIAIGYTPDSSPYVILPTPANVAATAEVNEWVELTLTSTGTLVAIGYLDGYTPSPELSERLAITPLAPPTVTAITRQGTTTATTIGLAWEVSESGWPDGYEVQAQVANGNWSSLVVDTTSATESATVTVGGDGNTLYDIRVRAVGAAEWYVAQDVMSGFTLAEGDFDFTYGLPTSQLTLPDYSSGGRPDYTITLVVNGTVVIMDSNHEITNEALNVPGNNDLIISYENAQQSASISLVWTIVEP